KAEADESQRANDESEHQHPPRANAVDEVPDRQLCHDRQNIGEGQGKAELDKADAKLRLQKGKKGRQDQIVKVIDEMGQRDHRDGTVFFASFATLFGPSSTA